MKEEKEVVVRGDILAGRFGVCSSCWGGTVDVYVNYRGGEGEEGEEGEEARRGGVDVREHSKKMKPVEKSRSKPRSMIKLVCICQ